MKNGSYQHHIIWKKEVWPKLPLVVTSRHSMPPVVTRCHPLYHSLSLVVTRCHSLSLVVPLVVTRCHSLSLFVPLVAIRYHSLYHSLSLVVTQCTTRLSFYKRSSTSALVFFWQLKFLTTAFFKHLINFEKKHCYKKRDQIFIRNLITQLFVRNFEKISAFWQRVKQSLIIWKNH